MGQVAEKTGAKEDINWLMEAMARMIRPVIRFAVGRVSCSALVNLVREVYVQEARMHLEKESPDQRVTRSALALLCGMDGRAIKAYEETPERQYTPPDVCSEAAILETWVTDEDFQSAELGEPASLLVHGPHGTFQRLVSRAAGRAVTPQTALERLLEAGNVELNESGTHVRLLDPSYMLVPRSKKSAIEAGSFAFNRLGRAVVHNTSDTEDGRAPWLQQDRWSMRIPASRLRVLRQEIRELLLKHIREVEIHLEKEESDPAQDIDCSVGVGWYYWEDADRRPL